VKEVKKKREPASNLMDKATWASSFLPKGKRRRGKRKVANVAAKCLGAEGVQRRRKQRKGEGRVRGLRVKPWEKKKIGLRAGRNGDLGV